MRSLFVASTLLALASGAMANDTVAELGIGGLTFVKSANLEMVSEDLFVSVDEIRVTYQFRNNADTDEHVLVAFPMPDITGSFDFMVSIPTDDPENFFGFATTFEGKPVDATLHQYAFAADIEQTDYLTSLGIPLAPQSAVTTEAINALSDIDKAGLISRGLVEPMEYDAGEGYTTDFVPIWTLKSTYSWEATFPAGETVEVVHTYKPSVGGTVSVSFLEKFDDYDPLPEYKAKYCMDDGFINAVKKNPITDNGYTYYPFTETWLSYIWSTGANWAGVVGTFTLTVDKGDPKNLVSFCGENVEKISPTQFRMTIKDWYPRQDKELEVLILNARTE